MKKKSRAETQKDEMEKLKFRLRWAEDIIGKFVVVGLVPTPVPGLADPFNPCNARFRWAADVLLKEALKEAKAFDGMRNA